MERGVEEDAATYSRYPGKKGHLFDVGRMHCLLILCDGGTTLRFAEDLGTLKVHGFSCAVNATNNMRALAPAGETLNQALSFD